MAAHQLTPDDDIYLDPNVVIQRLREEFAFVVVDKKKAAEEIRDEIKQLEEWRHRGVVSPNSTIEEEINELQSQLPNSYHVWISDDPDAELAYLKTVIMPGQDLVFGYFSRDHEAAAYPLVLRCAESLGYDILD